jgi:hypothetical protein
MLRMWIKSVWLLFTVMAVLSVSAEGGTQGKSMAKALLLSLAVPGAGQHYLGNHARARTMYVAEAGVWSTFAYFRVQGGNRKDRYQEMAGLFAGVGGERNDDYYRALAYYATSEEYNIDVMREARFRYPFDRDKQLEYFDANGFFGGDAWEWRSLDYQAEFRRTRTASKESYRRAVLTTGFAVLNRVVSMVDIYLSFRLEESRDQALRPKLRVDRHRDDGFRVYLSAPF